MIRSVVCPALAFLFALASHPLPAQQTPDVTRDAGATTARRRAIRRPPDSRIQPSDFTYMGAFRLPADGSRPRTFAYGGAAMTYCPAGDAAGAADGFPGSLYVTGHDRMPYGELPDGDQVAEVSIPAPVVARDVISLPVASLLQDFDDVSAGLFPSLDELPRLAMQFLSHSATGPLIHLAWGQHFQEEASTAVPSHAWFSPNLSAPMTRGTWYIGAQSPYSVNGYMLEIPRAWADMYAGGRLLGTGRFRDGGWSGMGPALFAYTPWQSDGSPPPSGTRLSEKALLLYQSSATSENIENALNGYQHPDAWEGAAWLTTPSGKDAVVFTGTKGTGTRYWYGYVNPAGANLPCVDAAFVGQFTVCRFANGTPCPQSDLVECAGHTSERGWWSSRFEAQFLLYATSDLARVASGAIAPSQPQPYATLAIDPYLFRNPTSVDIDSIGPGVQQRYRLADASFDRSRGLLYVLELFADEAAPVVHVFRVR